MLQLVAMPFSPPPYNPTDGTELSSEYQYKVEKNRTDIGQQRETPVSLSR
jgi:hypothetical protein